MSVFHLTVLLEACNTIVDILSSYRKCREINNKMIPQLEDVLYCIQNIKKKASLDNRTDAISCMAGQIAKVEDELVKHDAELENMNNIYTIVSSIERNLEQAQVSVLLEASPINNTQDKTSLIDNTRQAFGTYVLGSNMTPIVSGTLCDEGYFYFVMGKIYYEELTVVMDYEKSASFFNYAIGLGNTEALSYLGRQYEHGLGMEENREKAKEFYLKAAELEDPDAHWYLACIYESEEGYENVYRAIHHFRIAAEWGHEQAREVVAEYLAKITGDELQGNHFSGGNLSSGCLMFQFGDDFGTDSESSGCPMLQFGDDFGTDSESSTPAVENDPEEVVIALSKSGLPEDRKHELSEMARNECEGWKVNISDIEFARKPTGDRRRIGKGGGAEVYLARMKMRDENGDVIEGKHMEVAVKQFTVLRSRAEGLQPQFFREILLQKNAKHPCVVDTLGGYWPDPEDVEEEEEIEPWIVMERMNYNLIQVLDRQLLKTPDSKRRILADAAEGIAHLHSRRIVHRDIKPENVLLRVVDGEIIGRAKVCDFGVSRKAEETLTVTMDSFTRPNGTSLYMPPEAFSKSAQQGSKRARDIWSFGVLICEVLIPNFLLNIVNRHPEGVHAITGSGQFANEIAETVRIISWEGDLRDCAVSCLSLEPKDRPTIDDVLDKLREPCVIS